MLTRYDRDGAEEGTEYRLNAPLVVSRPVNGNLGSAQSASAGVQGVGVLRSNITTPASVATSP